MNCRKLISFALVATLLSSVYSYDYSKNVQDIYGRGYEPLAPLRSGVVMNRRQGVEEPPRVRRQGGGHEGVTGPVRTFVKTDEHAHFKWGVHHNVGHEYAGRR